MNNGVFSVSLDFELHWGGFEKWPLKNYEQYFFNTRNVIPELLRMFEQYGVHVTWATVGMLVHDSKESMQKVAPALKPGYEQDYLSAYNYIEQHGVGETESDDPFHFARSLVQRIINTPFQELGSHTFAHFYCNEVGQTVDQFRADLRSAQQSANTLGKTLRSLVFPRNQFNEGYLKVCCEEGFIAVRDNPHDWFWNIQSTQRESAWKRLNRGMDAYIRVGRETTYSLERLRHSPGLPVCIPASRLLRPYRPKELFLNYLKINRIKNEMGHAARSGEVYHLWWHPHNFGRYPRESMEGLKKILDHFALCKEKYGMCSLNMGEIADLVMQKKKLTAKAERRKGF